MSAPADEQRRRNDEYWAEPDPEFRANLRAALRAVPEPPELAEQQEAGEQWRARQNQVCAECGQPRRAHGFKANSNKRQCAFVATCPNEDDDVLCAVQPDGAFVPECGCPVHDPDEVNR